MKAIEKFEHPQFGEIRCMKDENGDPWFVGREVARSLGYKDPSKAVCDRVELEDKTSLLIQQSGSNYKANTCFINESGLYALILSSKLPQAKKFKHWVTGTVLPQIRKTGGYIPMNDGRSTMNDGRSTMNDGRSTMNDGRSTMNDADIMARALMIAQKTIELKNNLLEAQKPKVMFADAVTAQDDSIED